MNRNAKLLFIVLIFISAFVACRTQKQASPFRIMTFNIRYNNPQDGENAWLHRKEMVASMIRFHQADLVGMQEALKEQLMDLESRLPEFDWFGVGRDDGAEAGEFCPIFYRSQRFRLLDHGTFWLSETPNVKGSWGWDAACRRVVTWGKFKDRFSGDVFYHFNTHFDHRGELARRNSVTLLRKMVKRIAADQPVVVTGDFNFPPTSPLYAMMTSPSTPEAEDAVLFDAQTRSMQPPHGPDWTFNGFEAQGRPGHQIDYIFVNGRVEVLQYGVLSDRWDGRYPSDHLPVLAKIRIQ